MAETTEKAEPDTLLPCPFCGSAPRVAPTEEFGLPARHTIWCENYHCFGPGTTAANYADAKVQWNTRAAPPRCDAQGERAATIEECAKLCDSYEEWATDKMCEDEAPESTRNQIFATIGNTACDCAEMIRALSEKPAQETDHQKRPFAFAVRRAPENGPDEWRLFRNEGDAREAAEQLDGDYEGLYRVGDRRSAIRALSETKPAQGDSSGSLNKCSDDCPGDETCEYTKVCMCGMSIDHSPWDEGHSPISMHDYYYSSLAETKPAQGDAQSEALREALQKIADLVDSEEGEPLDDAIRIANAALSETKPAQAAWVCPKCGSRGTTDGTSSTLRETPAQGDAADD